MDLDLNDVLEVKEIRGLISHEKNLLTFFNELIKIKNIQINKNIETSDDEKDEDIPNDLLYEDYEDY